ncbi:unnamed protein product [Cyprideis torosa]|uniref:Uncharacterized protein n=1 Tax=Cyprideis torosa TaxID=163714 RepID=A0A7R8ZS38_9CRUS|nr:unnamed protein product [Cyprideis torosa]CAG0906020.1 unnamed protein product [Cyprideis torosa]
MLTKLGEVDHAEHKALKLQWRKKGGPQRMTPAPSLGPLIGLPPVRGLMDTATILQRTAVVHRVSIVELKTLLLISCKFRISGAARIHPVQCTNWLLRIIWEDSTPG